VSQQEIVGREVARDIQEALKHRAARILVHDGDARCFFLLELIQMV